MTPLYRLFKKILQKISLIQSNKQLVKVTINENIKLPTKIPPIKPIQNLNYLLELRNIHSHTVCSMTELSDKRIATGGGYKDRSISIFSFLQDMSNWKQDIIYKNAHNSGICSLVELPNNNQLISASADKTIKIWNIFKQTLTLTKTLPSHSSHVYKVITLNNNYFASCSFDNTLKIWESSEPFQEACFN